MVFTPRPFKAAFRPLPSVFLSTQLSHSMHPPPTSLSVEPLHVIISFMHTSVLVTSASSVVLSHYLAVIERQPAQRSQQPSRLCADIDDSTVILFALCHHLSVLLSIPAFSQQRILTDAQNCTRSSLPMHTSRPHPHPTISNPHCHRYLSFTAGFLQRRVE